MSWRPRLRTILLTVNMLILALPIGSIAALRIYESTLVRQTETELIAQGAFVAASYRAALKRVFPDAASAHYGRPIAAHFATDPLVRWRPRAATLDFARSDVLPPPRPAIQASPADDVALSVGREIAELLQDAQVVTLAGIRVLDFNGVVVASTGTNIGMSLTNRVEVKRALEGEHVSLLRERVLEEKAPGINSISRGTRVRVYVAAPIVLNDRVLGVALFARTPKNITQALYGKRYELLMGAVVLLTVGVLSALFSAYTISRPIGRVIRQARRAVQGETGAVVPLEKPVTREVEALSQAVASMARALEQRADYIATFAAHVSHEFKTPLTAIRGAIELIRDHDETMSVEQRTRFLHNIEKDSVRLEQLVSRLLELARADVMRVVEDGSADVTHTLAALHTRFADRGLTLTTTSEESDVTVAMDAETLESILASLLDNVIRHGGNEARINVERTTNNRVCVTVTDNGPGISSANAPRVFEPFFTTARKDGGTGLGLSVVRSLLDAHGGSICLGPTDAGGAVVVVHLPCTKSRANPCAAAIERKT